MTTPDLIYIASGILLVALCTTAAYLVAMTIREEVNKHMSKITETLAQLQADVEANTAKVEKARAEIVQKISDLEAALGEVTPEVQTALDNLKTAVNAGSASAQAIDDVVPDPAPPAEPSPAPADPPSE